MSNTLPVTQKLIAEHEIYDIVRSTSQPAIPRVEWLKITKQARIAATGKSSLPKDNDRLAYIAIADQLAKMGHNVTVRRSVGIYAF
jgi:hypothetical protein